MNIIEVKNNLVKLQYDENITLSSFIKITDLKNSYIAQILHLESSRIGEIAIARLIFNFKSGIQAYDGSIPSVQAEIEILNDDFLLNQLDKTDPILLGKLAQKNNDVIISAKLLKDRPIICVEKSYQYTQLINNIVKQNQLNERKTIVFDITGEVKGNKIVATEDFKIPLNKNSIDYIFDRGFDDLTKENKAFIQDIFSEVNEYIKTVEYIPFNDFNAVIDYEFKRTQQLQLIILKNRLIQFEKSGIFAQEQKDFKILDEKLNSENTIIIDLSRLNDSLQMEYITYIYSQIKKQNANYYSIVSLNNSNSTKEILSTILVAKNIFTSIVCPYSYKYLNELKQCSKNMFMFTPIKHQADFGAYNIFLNKLAEDEYILYGKATKFTPLILKLEELEDFSIVQKNDEIIKELDNVSFDNFDIFNKEDSKLENAEIKVESNDESKDIILEDKTEDETKIDSIEYVEPQIENSKDANPKLAEEIEEDLSKISIDIADDEIAEAVTNGIESNEVSKEIDDIVVPVEEIITVPTIEDDKKNITNESETSDIIVEELNNDTPTVIENIESEEVSQEINNNEEIIEEIDSELTDDDLDLIESLEKSDVQENNQVSDNIEIEEPEEVIELDATSQEELKEESDNEYNSESNKSSSITDEILEEAALKEQEELEKQNQAPIEEQIEIPQAPPKIDDKLETREGVTPIVPVYSAEIPDEDIVESDPIDQGDLIIHTEFGKGIVEKIINYGDRILCSVNFEQVGRRLLDPKISEIKKIK